jgi:hypothetical protein
MQESHQLRRLPGGESARDLHDDGGTAPAAKVSRRCPISMARHARRRVWRGSRPACGGCFTSPAHQTSKGDLVPEMKSGAQNFPRAIWKRRGRGVAGKFCFLIFLFA